MASSHSASGEQPVNCSIRSVNGSLHGNWDGGLRSFFKMKAGHQDEAPRIERDGIHVGDPVRIKSLGRRHTRLFGVVKFVGVVHCESTFDVQCCDCCPSATIGIILTRL